MLDMIQSKKVMTATGVQTVEAKGDWNDREARASCQSDTHSPM